MTLTTSLLALLFCVFAIGSVESQCLSSFNTLFDVSSSGSSIVVVGMCGSGNGSEVIYVSPSSRLAWTRTRKINSQNTWMLSGVQGFDNGNYVAVGGPGSILVSLDEGNSWTQRKIVGDRDVINDFFHSVRLVDGQNFLVGGSFGRIIQSNVQSAVDPAANWTQVTSGHTSRVLGQEQYAEAFLDGTYVSVGGQIFNPDQGPVAFCNSPNCPFDESSWVAGTLQGFSTMYMTDVATIVDTRKAVSQFVAVGDTSLPGGPTVAGIAVSGNGAQWGLLVGNVPGKLNSVAFSAELGVAVAVGTSICVATHKSYSNFTQLPENIYPAPLNSTAWLNRVSFIDQLSAFIAVGTNNMIWLSKDGFSWSDISPSH